MKHSIFVVLVIFVIGCDSNVTPTNKPTQLRSVSSLIQATNGDYRPSDKSLYFYDQNNKVQRIEYYTYNTQKKAFELFSTRNFTYSGTLLTLMEERLAASLHNTITHYTYSSGKLSKILQDDDVDTEATIKYGSSDTVEVDYNFSNGGYFKYRFALKEGNMMYEQTLDGGGRITSEVIHEYDNYLNPYSLLGYTDIVFRNYSTHNKTKTSSEYSGSFPVSVPVKYEYVYNTKNLPTEQLTTYQSYPDGSSMRLVKTLFEY